MLNKIIQFSLHNRILVLAAAMLLLVGGTYTAYHTEVDVFPDLNAPTVVIMTEANGMAAEEVEQLVTFPVETAVNGATHVRRVRSSSTNGFSVVWVEFDWGTDIYLARQIVSEKLAIVNEELPDNVSKPTLGPQSSILGELMIIGLTADSTSMLDLRTLADWTIRPRLLSTGGVAQVAVLGGDIKEYQISLDPARMKHYGVTLDEIMAVTRNMNRNANGGVLYEYGNEYIVRGVLSTHNVDELARAVVKTVDQVPVLLEDVADVGVGSQQPKLGTASVEGKPAVLITVTKQPKTGTIELTEKLDNSLKELQQNLPKDVKVSTDIFRQSRFIESSIGNVKTSLYEGAIFVVIVLFLFLANVRTTIISLITLPLSLVVSILVLHFMGLTINTMSLGGMAIAIGSLVDDAIVDVENVETVKGNRMLPESERLSVKEVVFNASKEVRMPILNSTLIIIVSFVPLFFLTGMEGRMLVPLGVAFIVALFASTVVALTLTPVLCSYLLGKNKGNGLQKDSFVAVWLRKYYKVALEWAIEHKRVVLGSTIALFLVAFSLFFTLGHSFLPSFNEGSFTINVSSLPGISLEESDKMGQRAEELLMTIPEIQTVARKTGRAELDEHALGVNTSEIEAPFELKDRSRKELTAEVREKLSTITGANIEIGQPISHRIDAMLSGTKASIAIKLFGTDLNKMFALGNQIKDAISNVEGIADLNVEQQIERPELNIVPKREILAKYGISLPEFEEFVNVNMAGEIVSQVYEEGKAFNLVVRTKDDRRDKIEKVRNLMIDAGDKKVPLHYVAEVRSTMGPNTISRENVKRKIVISANTSGRDIRSVVNDIQKRISQQISLPEGYHIEYGGQFESEQAASRTLFLTSVMSIFVIFLLLYSEFKNMAQSAIILINLPLALIGGVFALLFTTGEVSIPAIIGLISLFGIATRNGMLLISHYNQLRSEGLGLRDSVIKGSLDRLNPILMTALSSALAMIPLAVNGDLAGNEIQSPMAKVILGGLLTSTFLNGFIIPIVYMMMNRKKGSKYMKILTMTILLLYGFGCVEAQTNYIERILRDIEKNNKELQAGEQNLTAQKMGTKIENNLSNPEVSYSYQYGREDDPNQSEMTVTQGFDFPTQYAARHQYGKLQSEAYEKRFGILRRDVLLKAKELCLDMIRLNQQKALLNNRKANAEELVKFYEKRLQTGDANILETNKVKLELMAVNTEVAENDAAFRTALQSLLAMNGNMPLTFDETEYPVLPELTGFDRLRDEIFATDYELQSVATEKEAARKMVTVSKNGWLPGLQVGYRRSGSIGDEIHGFIVGGSIPLFENRGKVKKAKAEALNAELQQQNTVLRIEAELHSQFNEAQQLKSSMDAYDLLLMKNTLGYLKQALMAGQISVIEYFTEVESIYQNQQKYMDLENRYQKVMAQLYKNSL